MTTHRILKICSAMVALLVLVTCKSSAPPEAGQAVGPTQQEQEQAAQDLEALNAQEALLASKVGLRFKVETNQRNGVEESIPVWDIDFAEAFANEFIRTNPLLTDAQADNQIAQKRVTELSIYIELAQSLLNRWGDVWAAKEIVSKKIKLAQAAVVRLQ